MHVDKGFVEKFLVLLILFVLLVPAAFAQTHESAAERLSFIKKSLLFLGIAQPSEIPTGEEVVTNPSALNRSALLEKTAITLHHSTAASFLYLNKSGNLTLLSYNRSENTQLLEKINMTLSKHPSVKIKLPLKELNISMRSLDLLYNQRTVTINETLLAFTISDYFNGTILYHNMSFAEQDAYRASFYDGSFVLDIANQSLVYSDTIHGDYSVYIAIDDGDDGNSSNTSHMPASETNESLSQNTTTTNSSSLPGNEIEPYLEDPQSTFLTNETLNETSPDKNETLNVDGENTLLPQEGLDPLIVPNIIHQGEIILGQPVYWYQTITVNNPAPYTQVVKVNLLEYVDKDFLSDTIGIVMKIEDEEVPTSFFVEEEVASENTLIINLTYRTPSVQMEKFCEKQMLVDLLPEDATVLESDLELTHVVGEKCYVRIYHDTLTHYNNVTVPLDSFDAEFIQSIYFEEGEQYLPVDGGIIQVPNLQ